MRRLILLAASAMMLGACKDGSSPDEVTLSMTPDSVTAMVGQQVTLTTVVTHSTTQPSYASRNNGIATVDASGRVTGVGAGTTFVVATLGTIKDSSKIVVFAPAPTLDLSPDSVSVLVNGTRALTATLTNTTGVISYTSRNTAIATVNGSGVVTGVGLGSTYVVATAGTLRDSTKVVVSQTVANAPIIPLLGTGVVSERYTAEVSSKGNYVYTTTWSTRQGNPGNAVKIWNVSGNVPQLVDSLITGAGVTTSDVQVSDDSTLLAVSTEVGNSADRGVYLYSLTNPAKPTFITKFTSTSTTPGVHTLKFGRVNNKLYLFLNIDPPAALVVIDVTTPTAPVEVGRFPMGNPYIHDVFFRDGLLFAALWNAGMSVYDVGGGGKGGAPGNPVLLGNIVTKPCPGCAGAEVHNIWWFKDPKTGSNKYAFIGEEGPATIGAWARGDIHVVDVSDFANMQEVAFFRPDSATSSTGPNATGVHNFDMDEQSGVLYAAYYNGGVRALDVRGDLSTCAANQKDATGRCNLRLMGRELGMGLVSSPTFIWGVRWVGNFLYASDMLNGVHKLNVTTLRR